MPEWDKQTHVTWYCLYHVVFIPKYRKKVIFGRLREEIGAILRELCQQFKIGLVIGNAMPDHIHMCLSINDTWSKSLYVGLHESKCRVGRFKMPASGKYAGARGYWGNMLFITMNYMIAAPHSGFVVHQIVNQIRFVEKPDLIKGELCYLTQL